MSGSEPPELPLASGSGASQGTAARAAADEEADLFGSSDDEAGGAAASAHTPTAGSGVTLPSALPPTAGSDVGARDTTAAVGGAAGGAGVGDDDAVDADDLFGSEIGDDDANDPDERDLFGDDDDEEEGVARKSQDQPAASAATGSALPMSQAGTAAVEPVPRRGDETPDVSDVFSEMDEREIFGDFSDDEEEPDKVEDVVLLRRPGPPADRSFLSLRLPNVLSVEKKAFNRSNVLPVVQEGYRESKNSQDKQVVQLVNPENCVRWRFKKSEDGQIQYDDEGRPQYESNTRIVEWEDGSKTLFVGTEAYKVSIISDKVVLFEDNTTEVAVCHGVISHRMLITPHTLDSATHDSLKKAQYRKYEPIRRSIMATAQEQADAKQLLELEMEQKRRLETKKKREIASQERGLTQEFLEGPDDGGVGPSILDMKREAKRPRT